MRPYSRETDEAFIYSTWLKNYKYSSYFAKRIRPAIFFPGHHAIIDHLLRKNEVRTLVAHPKDDNESILGWLCFEPRPNPEIRPIIHFVFVKEAFRKMGVAQTLLKAAEIDINQIYFTHWTYPVDDFKKKYEGMEYDPYKL